MDQLRDDKLNLYKNDILYTLNKTNQLQNLFTKKYNV